MSTTPHTHRRVRGLLLLTVLLVAAILLAGRAAARPSDHNAGDPPRFGISWQTRAALELPNAGLAFSDPAARRLYVIGDWQGLDVYDADTLARLGNIPHYPAAYALSTDGARLYIAPYFEFSSDDPAIYLYDTPGLTLSRAIPYSCAGMSVCGIYALAEGPGDRLYVARADQAAFDIIDTHTGARLHTESIAPRPYPEFLSLAAYDDTLYVGSYYDQTADAAGVTVFNIAGVVPVRVDFQPTNEGIQRLAVAGDGAYVTADGFNHIYQYRADPFTLLWDHAGYFGGVYANGDVLQQDADDPPDDANIITAHDAETGAAVRGVVEKSDVGFLPIDDAGLALYLTATERLEFRSPSDFASAVPLVLNNACPSGAFVDTFDDPASGWPIRADERVVYEITGGVYRVLLRPAGVWTGLSRGDNWRNGDYLSITAQLAGHNEGTFGLIYDLNDDWSEFYTFEVYPAEDLWLVAHFHDGAWDIITVQDHFIHDTIPTYVAMRRDNDTGGIQLLIDNYLVGQVADFDGRVGLAISSFEANFEVHFDNYVLGDKRCISNPVRAAPSPDAPPAVAPPLPPRPPLQK